MDFLNSISIIKVFIALIKAKIIEAKYFNLIEVTIIGYETTIVNH